jgi:hypothetical protein
MQSNGRPPESGFKFINYAIYPPETSLQGLEYGNKINDAAQQH